MVFVYFSIFVIDQKNDLYSCFLNQCCELFQVQQGDESRRGALAGGSADKSSGRSS